MVREIKEKLLDLKIITGNVFYFVKIVIKTVKMEVEGEKNVLFKKRRENSFQWRTCQEKSLN